MVRIRWTFSVDAERVAALVPAGATPCEVVDALLAAADREGPTIIGLRYRALADELGDALDRLPRRPVDPLERQAARRGDLGPFRPEADPILLPAQRTLCPTCRQPEWTARGGGE